MGENKNAMETGIKHDGNGRFVKGNSGGPGRPKRQAEAAYMNILQAVCSPDEFAAIAKRAVSDAIKGDAKARDWLSKYLIGDPERAVAALQVNNYQVDEVGVNDFLVQLIELVSSVAGSLTEAQRDEFSRRARSLATTVNQLPADVAKLHTVDDHGVVSFRDQIRPFQRD